MMKRNTTYNSKQWAHTLCGVVAIGMSAMAMYGLIACTGDDDPSQDNRDLLTLVPYVSEPTELTTRAVIDGVTVPDNYVRYSTLYPQADPQYATIGVFMTPNDAAVMGTFVYQGENASHIDQWKSNIYVNPGTEYYMYGFMPRETAETAHISALSGQYANGAILDIDNLDIVTPADLCVVVGVEQVPWVETYSGSGVYNPQTTGNVQFGAFRYMSQAKGRNFVRLLLDHLYAALHFKMQVNDVYSGLRKIKLRKVEFETTKGKTVDVEIKFTANNTGAYPIVNEATDILYTNTVSGTSSATIFDKTDGEWIPAVSDGSPLDVPGFFAPIIDGIVNTFSIVVTYDVYNSDGTTLVREGCTARNKVPNISPINRGEKYTINLTINPTYLYQLANPDLDNPTIKLTVPTP